jgi:hypothetical protein
MAVLGGCSGRGFLLLKQLPLYFAACKEEAVYFPSSSIYSEVRVKLTLGYSSPEGLPRTL